MTPIRLDGRVALVTGAGRGLGASHARALAADASQVVVHDAGVEVDGSGGDPAVADAGRGRDRVGRRDRGRHVREPRVGGSLPPDGRACGRAVRPSRRGRPERGTPRLEELEEADRSWDRMMRVNVDAPFHLTRAALPVMKRNRYGRFVFTTSGRAMSVEDTRLGLAAYAVGKKANFALMLVAAAEGRDHGIAANAISPAAAIRMVRREVRPGELDPEQVSPAVVFLASERGSFSGKVLEAAGGRFSVARWTSSQTLDVGRRPVEPEQIEEHWAEIEGVPE